MVAQNQSADYYQNHMANVPRAIGPNPNTNANININNNNLNCATNNTYRLGPYANGLILKGRYRLESTIGKGSFGKVKLATDLTCPSSSSSSSSKVAIKFIPRTNIKKPAHWTRIQREINLTGILSHSNIVRLLDHFETATDIVLVQEYVPGSDLFDLIVAKGKLPLVECKVIFRQMTMALDYLHRHNVVHRDLKPENVMVDTTSSTTLSGQVAKLIDFGFATLYHPDQQLSTNCGSPLYAAPEIVRGIKYTGPEVDCWSLGIILYCMITGTLPFEDDSLKGLYEKICVGLFTMPEGIEPALQQLLMGLICVDRDLRLTISEVKRHPWVGGCEITLPKASMMTKAIRTPLDEEIMQRLERDFKLMEARRQVWYPHTPAHSLYTLMMLMKSPSVTRGDRLGLEQEDPWTIVLLDDKDMQPLRSLPKPSLNTSSCSIVINSGYTRSDKPQNDYTYVNNRNCINVNDISNVEDNNVNNFVMQAAASVMSRFRRLREYAK